MTRAALRKFCPTLRFYALTDDHYTFNYFRLRDWCRNRPGKFPAIVKPLSDGPEYCTRFGGKCDERRCHVGWGF